MSAKEGSEMGEPKELGEPQAPAFTALAPIPGPPKTASVAAYQPASPPVESDGRPADADKVFARRVVEAQEVRQHIEDVLNRKAKPDKEWHAYYKYEKDRAYGRPAQPIEGGDERKPLVVRVIPYGKPA